MCRMEDVLEVYHRPYEYDNERPVVCFDETSKQLLEGCAACRIEARSRIGMGRYDTEYQRNGVTRNLFMLSVNAGRVAGGVVE